MKCICGSDMILKDSKYGKFYGCERFPLCKNTHGCHPNGTPLGIPADKETRELRHRLHEIMNQKFNYKSKKGRKQMYKFLKENTATGHIGSMMKPEIIKLIEYFNNNAE